MNRKPIAALICLSVLCIRVPSPATSQQTQQPPSAQTPSVDVATVPDPDEYAVWSILLEKKFAGTHSKKLVIRDRTALHVIAADIEKYAYLSEDAFSDLQAKNTEPYALENKFTVTLPCILISKETEATLFPLTPNAPLDVHKIIDGWRQFYREYPGAQGILTVSRVGFNSDKSQAVVYVTNHVSIAVFADRYFLLVKKNGSWEIQSEKLLRFS